MAQKQIPGIETTLARDDVKSSEDYRIVRDTSSGSDVKTPAGSAGGYDVGAKDNEVPTNSVLGISLFDNDLVTVLKSLDGKKAELWVTQDAALDEDLSGDYDLSGVTVVIKPGVTVTADTESQTIDFNIKVQDGGQFIIDEDVTVEGNLISEGYTAGVVAFDAVDGDETLTYNGGKKEIAGVYKIFGDSLSIDGFRWLNFAWFGGVGDADRSTLTGTDNFPFLEKAVRSDCSLYIPPASGYYLFDLQNNGEITKELNNFEIYGNRIHTKLCFVYEDAEYDSMTVNMFNKSLQYISLFKLQKCDMVIIRDLHLDGSADELDDGTSQRGAAWFIFPTPQADDDCKNIYFHDCDITKFYQGPIQTDRDYYSHNVYAYNLYVHDIGKHGVAFNYVNVGYFGKSYLNGCGNEDYGPGDPGGLAIDISRANRNIIVDDLIVKNAKGLFKIEGDDSYPLNRHISISNIIGRDFIVSESNGYQFKVDGEDVNISNIDSISTITKRGCVFEPYADRVNLTNIRIENTGAEGTEISTDGEISFSNYHSKTNSNNKALNISREGNKRLSIDSTCSFITQDEDAVRITGENDIENLIFDGVYLESESLLVSVGALSAERTIKHCKFNNMNLKNTGDGKGIDFDSDVIVKACHIIGNTIYPADGVTISGNSSVNIRNTDSDYNIVKNNLVHDDYANIITQGTNTIEKDNLNFTLT